MKKFEEYNLKYKHLARVDEQEEPHIQDLARDMDKWPERVTIYPMSEIVYAVYMAPDHEEWQQFRASLKGQSTKMKLARLWLYLQSERCKAESIRSRNLCEIRVSNYLGALVRGGQLNTKYEVQR